MSSKEIMPNCLTNMKNLLKQYLKSLDSEISVLKSKTHLLVEVSHLHEAHLHHLEEMTDTTNKLLGDIMENYVWFTAKLMDTIENKFQSVIHHHENVVKSAIHHCLVPGALPHDVLDEILNHTLTVTNKQNLVSLINYTSDLFQVEVSHLYDPKKRNSLSSCTFPLFPMPTCSSCMNFCCFWFISTSSQTFTSHWMSGKTTSWPLDTHASTSETPSFAREGKWWRQVYKIHA